jgi:RNA polymerase sigma-70 factor (ECF subfamily)
MKQFEFSLRTNFLKGVDGDAAAYRQFLQDLREALKPHLTRMLLRLRQSQLDADDVVQETLLAVHNKRHTYDGETPLTAWITAIARYKVIDVMRRSTLHDFHVPIQDAEPILSAGDVEIDSRLTLRKAICGLPEKMKEALKLVKIQGMSIREAALTTGSSEASVKVSVHRASRLLKGMLQP